MEIVLSAAQRRQVGAHVEKVLSVFERAPLCFFLQNRDLRFLEFMMKDPLAGNIMYESDLWAPINSALQAAMEYAEGVDSSDEMKDAISYLRNLCCSKPGRAPSC